MKIIEIYDPAMCCSTGVCGPSIDQELLRVATLIDSLNKNGANIKRFNLTSNPQAFVTNTKVNELLQKDNDILPITIVNDQIVKTKEYLTNEEFSNYTGIVIISQPTEVKLCPESGSEDMCCCVSDEDEWCTSEKEEVLSCCSQEDSGCC